MGNVINIVGSTADDGNMGTNFSDKRFGAGRKTAVMGNEQNLTRHIPIRLDQRSFRRFRYVTGKEQAHVFERHFHDNGTVIDLFKML